MFEPTVSFVFINQDSIKQLNDSLDVFAFNDSILNLTINSLNELRNRLDSVNTAIINGSLLFQEKQDLEEWIDLRQADSLFYALLNEDADSLTTVFNATKATINSGLIQVNQIEIIGENFVDTFEEVDRATSWKVPLSFRDDFNQYEVSFDAFSEIIELSYDVKEELDEDRNILIRAENIQVVERTYARIDSVKSNCEENCIDGNAVFTFYF